ncbi:MAG: alanine/glycine:cation symporter family protein [Cyanobacteria bacterium P01_G01_bin.54]
MSDLHGLAIEQWGLLLLVAWAVLGSMIFTLWLRFANLRCWSTALALLRQSPLSQTGLTSRQALTTSLSGTVGLGNIAGVAIAITVGGPGACLWMTVAGFLTMNTRLIECTLGQRYRQRQADGTIVGGPMYYLAQGLARQGRARLGQGLATAFALLLVLSTLGSSSLFQSGQSYIALHQVLPQLPPWGYGGVMVLLVTLITLGGVRRLGKVTERLVPLMCGGYILMALYVVLSHWTVIPEVVHTIVTEAFAPRAGLGGLLGVIAQGFRRATFSNEGGLGTAAIAHAAVETEQPIEEGIVATLEPCMDTLLICNLTALAILVTGVESRPEFEQFTGVELTSTAFGSVVGWFPGLLALVTFCFAFSTILSWGYYGQQAWCYLFGARSRRIYQTVQLGVIFAGVFISPAIVVEFSDAALLLMTVPNLLGLYFLAGEVKGQLDCYLASRLVSRRQSRQSSHWPRPHFPPLPMMQWFAVQGD